MTTFLNFLFKPMWLGFKEEFINMNNIKINAYSYNMNQDKTYILLLPLDIFRFQVNGVEHQYFYVKFVRRIYYDVFYFI